MLISERPPIQQDSRQIASAVQDISRELRSLQVSFQTIDRQRDTNFLFQVYSSTREAELSVVDWSDTHKTDFLHMQCNAQHTYFQSRFPSAELLAIVERSTPIGRLYITRESDEFRILDITLLPRFRERGIGTSVLTSILKLAHREHMPVCAYVERYNPAIRLFRRLGFRQMRNVGITYQMEWNGPS